MTDQRDRDTLRLSFGQVAADYDRIRPSYPPDAVAWAIGDAADDAACVIDLGAGTGLLTRVIINVLGGRGDVLAIEPDDGMRARLADVTSGARALRGSAERIPVEDGHAGAVLAGQAYHWFDHEKAHPEIARVLKPGGVFAPIWNIRDESVEWVARISEEFEGRAVETHEGIMANADFGPWFDPVEAAQFPMSVTMTGDDVVALMKSRSYFITAEPGERAVMERRVREIVADLGERFEMPYVTYAYRARRR